MKVVIDIPKETYEALVINQYCGSKSNLENIIVNGTPLPKGHGRLIDYDNLIETLDRYGRKNVKYQLPYSPTIIFADKEVNADEDSD